MKFGGGGGGGGGIPGPLYESHFFLLTNLFFLFFFFIREYIAVVRAVVTILNIGSFHSVVFYLKFQFQYSPGFLSYIWN